MAERRRIPSDWPISSVEHVVIELFVRVSAAEIAAMGHDRAEAFFAGIAKLIAIGAYYGPDHG